MTSPWFVRPQPKRHGALRLFCFAHAGGSASAFHHWGARLAEVDVWAVQLPGREGRMAEPLLTDFETLQHRLLDALAPWLDRPFAFFGHSMGAIVAYEMARRLRHLGLPSPGWLYLSGRHAPTLPNPDPPLHPLSDAEFIAELKRRFQGLPAAILAEPDLLALFLPILRADLRMLERHVFSPGNVLHLPLIACGGQQDPQTSVAALEAWSNLTTSEDFGVRRFPGGHFYLHERREDFLTFLGDDLGQRMSQR
jgi:medium-chain acyl-[acyl-carrier-protein] hydrolase